MKQYGISDAAVRLYGISKEERRAMRNILQSIENVITYSSGLDSEIGFEISLMADRFREDVKEKFAAHLIRRQGGSEA